PDPLNLVGILTPGARLPSLSGNRLLYRDGVPIALLAAGEVSFLEELAPQQQWEVRNLLLRRQVPAVLADLACAGGATSSRTSIRSNSSPSACARVSSSARTDAAISGLIWSVSRDAHAGAWTAGPLRPAKARR